MLTRYPWPGNVRELHNLVEWLTITCRSTEIGPADLPPTIRAGSDAVLSSGTDAARPALSLLSLGLSAEELERQLLREALDRSQGNISEAARLLKMTRNTLRYRMAKFQLS